MPFPQYEEDIDGYHSAVAIAKQAFANISAFKTPPVPEVYEVWYRYAEGINVEICEQLSKLVERESIGASELVMLREQHIDRAAAATATSHTLSCRIGEQLDRIQGLLQGQKKASTDFSGTIAQASSYLQQDDLTSEDLSRFIDLVVESNQKLQRQMTFLDSRLEDSKIQIDELRIQLRESQRAITTDSLTGVGNRRYFEAIVAEAYQGEVGVETTYLFLIDLDDFKLVNDQFGHTAGDEVLKFVASTLAAKAGRSKVARYGGDEFAVVTSFEDPSHANQMAVELCSYFCNNSFEIQRSGETLERLTVSIGAAKLRSEDDINTWIERSDKFLYAAKNGGRNRSMVERKIT